MSPCRRHRSESGSESESAVATGAIEQNRLEPNALLKIVMKLCKSLTGLSKVSQLEEQL